MATRNYDEMAKAVDVTAAVKMEPGISDWDKRDIRRFALEHAVKISEVGAKASDIIADAKLYVDFLLGE